MSYEALIAQYKHLIITESILMPKGLSGLYIDNQILINKRLSLYEKHCVLAEEIGHYETTYGDITKLEDVKNQKLELVARRWGYEKIVSLDKLIECYVTDHTTVEDICLHLEITPQYLHNAIEKYQQRYGLSTIYNGYRIFFDPLNMEKVFFKP
ncbi:ImmA/IrrE family metallo-endopeptidase [Viridibacillus sp. YIM B01967]|uniref:ImmA/IrrE family metallo-endopeptidase n=1 Tax=Viridibacillus soli TaxID=2798301 RepID=A0ABS1H244_9BACL|nr:ImmA/IrrE family metallo-endopeptidase [Viridibacillus soli]MBK3493478.1 ImmA/IrrE family metallo-endopeptidase [Viridibacillus soli]